jgi:tRNA pseudouridine38-40 synthase
VSTPSSADPAGRRFRLTLHYDGERFNGWQIQPGVRTVQDELERVLSRLADRRIATVAAGRTDTGVHATGQVASAVLPARWKAADLERAVNALLPDDIWVAAVEEVPLDFHARYDAVARGYLYRVGTLPSARSPFARRWCWPLGLGLDLAVLNDAARRFAGSHSFRAFARSGQPERGEQCTVGRSVWAEQHAGVVAYEVTANRFLHHMVRYMVGTMVDVARGRRPASDIDGLLRAEAGLETSPPAPASGLFLAKVYYDEGELERNDELPFHPRFATAHADASDG